MQNLRKLLLALWVVAGLTTIAAMISAAKWSEQVLPITMTVFTCAGLAWLVIVVVQHRSRYETLPPP